MSRGGRRDTPRPLPRRGPLTCPLSICPLTASKKTLGLPAAAMAPGAARPVAKGRARAVAMATDGAAAGTHFPGGRRFAEALPASQTRADHPKTPAARPPHPGASRTPPGRAVPPAALPPPPQYRGRAWRPPHPHGRPTRPEGPQLGPAALPLCSSHHRIFLTLWIYWFVVIF